MRKNKVNLLVLGLSFLSLMFILTSGILLANPYKANAEAFCQSQVSCPDGRRLTCKGTSYSTDESDPNDPSCTGDGKVKRCSDPVESNSSNDKKKKDDKTGNVNSSTNSNANGNMN